MTADRAGNQSEGEITPLRLPGNLDALPQIATYVCQAATRASLNYKSSYWLRLAVDEIATNIIIHGYTEAGQRGTLRLWSYWDDDYLAIVLEDRGITYDPVQASLPEKLDCPLQERQPGGLGIYLALWGVDEFYYEPLQNCNRSTFLVKRKER